MSARGMFFENGRVFSDREERLFSKQELVYKVTEDLLVAIEHAGISKQELANKLGKSKSFVSQILNGERNMTLGTLSDICYSLNLKPQFSLKTSTNELYGSEMVEDELPVAVRSIHIVKSRNICANEEQVNSWETTGKLKKAIGF